MRKDINPSEALATIDTIMGDTFTCITEINPDTWGMTTREIWRTYRYGQIYLNIVGYSKSTGKLVDYYVAIHGVTNLVIPDKKVNNRYRELKELYFNIKSKLTNSIEERFGMERIKKERCQTEENLQLLWSKLKKLPQKCDNMDKFMLYANNLVLMFNQKIALPNFVVTSVHDPYYNYPQRVHIGVDLRIQKETDNLSKKKVFDFITVDIPIALAHIDTEERINLLKEYSEPIDNFAVRTIKNSKDFKKYGVPVNILRCTKKVYTRDGRLVYTFEIKEIGA